MSTIRQIGSRTQELRHVVRDVHSHRVDRARLIELFRRFRDSDHRLLTLWAPGGAGKTTVLSSWACAARADGDLVESIDAGDLTDGELRVTDPERVQLLFIDNVERLAGGAGIAPIVRLVQVLAPGTRVVIAGRFEPSGFAEVVDNTDGLFEVPSRELAFDVAETLSLALRFDLVLAVQDAEALTDRTGGWAAGVALAMPFLASQDDRPAAIARFGGDHHQVADYLVVRILDALDDCDRDVLMRAAVGTRVPLALAIALTDRQDVGAVLQRLSARNTLVEVDDDLDGFRFHPILASYMRAEFRRRAECSAVQNHVAAARWYESRGAHDLAFEQALLSRDPAVLAEQIERSGGALLMRGLSAMVATALRILPPDRDTLAVAVVRLSMDAPAFPDPIGAQERLEQIDGLITEAPAEAVCRWTPVVLALRALMITDPADAEARLRELGAFMRDTPTGSFDNALVLRAAVAWCLVVAGHDADADELLRSVQAAALRAGYSWVFLIAVDTAASLAVRAGDWRAASTLEEQMSAVQLDLTPPYNRATARAVVVATMRKYLRCEPVSFTSLHRLDVSDPIGAELGLFFPVRALLLLAAIDASPTPREPLARLVRLVRYDGTAHARMVATIATRLSWWSAVLHGPAAAAEVRRLLTDVLGADSMEALTLRAVSNVRGDRVAHEALVAAVENGTAWSGVSVVNANLALATHAHELGNAAEATDRIRAALATAEEFGFAREFLACRGAGAQLVYAHRGSYGALEPYADHVIALAEHEHVGVGTEAPDTSVPLTPKEQELLLELPAHQTVAEIAVKHHLSVNTIKTHLRSIYAKLAVSGRTDAVNTARRRGLL
ncbi:LuxR C-terminal-related transcriptional regulator [Curtobacterium sp. PhB115]|uniref:helix-turn-helix transcriptional regulator n=1 Tax=Curtobacterium sp. PhB115 TaxID=2485173 RepID=UPI000FA88F97|nr:LuxR C-terminal-related transcriptional regulator [Curtobacterium sp. PhB115]ROP74596.1 ATP/maltotriose-dependent transcriptional regulator MalT [Curtobacterium sp. PhB115]